MGLKLLALILLLSSTGGLLVEEALAHDYVQALDLTLQFFEAQRSGILPTTQRSNWRANSGLEDGKAQGVDLVGGYYDAGDNIKFQFPMAFTITTLAWSAIEYRSELNYNGQLQNALEAIKWGTDYFIKAHPEPNVLWVQVGNGDTDHRCWMRPEDMTTPRTAYKIDTSNPGSDVAAESAAAMAAASIVFRDTDPLYSQTLVTHAKQLFDFADRYRGRYHDSISVAKNFYASINGYNDELLWGAFWMFEATGEQNYLDYAVRNAVPLGGIGWTMNQFGWDSKYSGVHVLASKIVMEGRGGVDTHTLRAYQTQAESFMCSALGKKSAGPPISRSKAGMLYRQHWNNMQFVTAASFLVTVYGDYMVRTNQGLVCSGQKVQPSELLGTAKQQIDYLLGSNPKRTSYMVGYGNNFPQFVHHRAASIVSIKVDPSFVSCRMGYTWFDRLSPNPNVLNGAIVGGPDKFDEFRDRRDYVQSGEPTTYNSGPVVGVLARLAGSPFGADGGEVFTEKLDAVQQNETLPQNQDRRNITDDENQEFGEDDESLDLKLDIHQLVVGRWRRGNVEYFKVLCTVFNRNERDVRKLVLTFDKVRGQVFGLRPLGSRGKENSFTFPRGMKSLVAGRDFKFLYIFHQAEANISIKQALLV